MIFSNTKHKLKKPGANLGLCFELGCIPKLSKQHILYALFAVAQELTGTVQTWREGGKQADTKSLPICLSFVCTSLHQMPGRKTQSKQISNLMSLIPLHTQSPLFLKSLPPLLRNPLQGEGE